MELCAEVCFGKIAALKCNNRDRGIMLQKLSHQVRKWHECAAEAKQRAEAATDPRSKAEFLDIERHWLSLASSYAFAESLSEFQKLEERARADIDAHASLRLQEISTLLIQEGNLDALYERVLEAAISLMSADMGTMQKYDPEPDELLLLAGKGEFHPEAATFWARVNRGNACTCGMALSLGRRVIVPDVETSDFMAGTADLSELRRSSIRAAQSTPLVSRSGRLLGMISTHWRDPHHPAEDELRAVDILARQAADLIERTQVEAALRESEQHLRWLASIVDSSYDPIISTDIDRKITTWNHAAEQLYGYTFDEVIGKPITILHPPDRPDEQRTIPKRIKRGERIKNHETVRQRKDRTLVDVSVTISPVRNAEGKVVGSSSITRDITERKRAQEHEKMLMAELDHRVKNVLSRVDMVFMSSRNGSSSIDEFTRSVRGRIQSMAAAHSLLSENGWRGVGLKALVRNQLAPYASHANVAIHGTDVILTPAAIQAMGMVLHELVTNAAKYGAFSVPTGSVAVSWERKPNGHARNLVFTWRELGGPAVAVEAESGYGTRLIRGLVPHELGGTVDLQFAPEGVSCRLEFPLSSEP
jgi:PAS domain S-box-containing protein